VGQRWKDERLLSVAELPDQLIGDFQYPPDYWVRAQGGELEPSVE
jgi:hypothetical protein